MHRSFPPRRPSLSALLGLPLLFAALVLALTAGGRPGYAQERPPHLDALARVLKEKLAFPVTDVYKSLDQEGLWVVSAHAPGVGFTPGKIRASVFIWSYDSAVEAETLAQRRYNSVVSGQDMALAKGQAITVGTAGLKAYMGIRRPSRFTSILEVDGKKRILGGAEIGFRCGNLLINVWELEPSVAVHDGTEQQLEAEGTRIGEGQLALVKNLAERLANALHEQGTCSGTSFDLLDGNPKFTDGVTFFRTISDAQLEKLAVGGTKRSGAAADGLSRLLVRAELPEAGKVTFKLDGEQKIGGLLKLMETVPINVGNPDQVGKEELETFTTEIKKKHYAFAVYMPPKEFGRKYADRLSHRFALKLRWEAEKSGPGFGRKVEPISSERGIEVVRPPVVLVHGTYDNPTYCWRQAHKEAKATSTMYDRLTRDGHFHVFTVDYEKSNGGHQNGPSKLMDNQRVLMDNPGGLGDAFNHFRGTCGSNRCGLPHSAGMPTYAVTQAYVVAHSLGGLVTRAYCRGTTIQDDPVGAPNVFRSPPQEHFNPDRKDCPSCWYHRSDNYHQGDVKGIITLSTTHMGSDVPGAVLAFMKVYERKSIVLNPSIIQTWILAWAVNHETGTKTGAFENQQPNNPVLNHLGATPVPAHAVACIADDAELDELYLKRLLKIWLLCPPDVLREGFADLGQAVDGTHLAAIQETYKKAYDVQLLLKKIDNPADVIEDGAVLPALRLRSAVFGNGPNDCTVRQESSLGGLKEPFAAVIPHVLHGYAPAYTVVQNHVLELLAGPGGPNKIGFDPKGFPPAGGPVKQLPPEARWDKHFGSSLTMPTLNKPGTGNPGGGGNQGAFLKVDPGTGSFGLVGAPGADGFTIKQSAPGTPAAAAGLKPGDVILAVDGKRIAGLKAADIEERLRAGAGKNLTVVRGEEILSLKIPALPTVGNPPVGGGVLPTKGLTAEGWNLQPGTAKAEFQGRDLAVSVEPGQSGAAQAWARSPLQGDVTFDFHHRLLDWQHQPGDTLSVELRLAIAPRANADTPALVIRRRIAADGTDTLEVGTERAQRGIPIKGKHLDLALRRRGNTWSVLHFNPAEGGWVQLARLDLELTDRVYPGFAVQKKGASRLDLQLMIGDGGSVPAQ